MILAILILQLLTLIILVSHRISHSSHTQAIDKLTEAHSSHTQAIDKLTEAHSSHSKSMDELVSRKVHYKI